MKDSATGQSWLFIVAGASRNRRSNFLMLARGRAMRVVGCEKKEEGNLEGATGRQWDVRRLDSLGERSSLT